MAVIDQEVNFAPNSNKADRDPNPRKKQKTQNKKHRSTICKVPDP